MKNTPHYLPAKPLGLTFLFFLLFIIHLPAQISGDYPYFESFLSATKPTGIEIPKPDQNSVIFSNKGAVLTPAEFDKFGAMYLDNHQFDASAGLFISFEYMTYDGTGGDGLSVFFFDASKTPYIGAPGAGIGYTYNRSANKHPEHSLKRAIGSNAAYLGIAFDSFGNFKKMFYQGEARVNGLPYGFGVTGTSELGPQTDNDVTLRGAMNYTPMMYNSKEVPGMGVGYVGYPVLVTQSTMQNIGHRLKKGSGTDAINYAFEKYNQLSPNTIPFPIKGGHEFERQTDPGYRRAYIELFPNKETGNGGFFISVMIENENRRDTIIYDYEYRERFIYLENAWHDDSGDNNDDEAYPTTPSRRKELIATVPAALKIGFAAATGSFSMEGAKNDKHVIKNLRLILPRAAEAYDDFEPDEFQGTTVFFNPLENDIGYKGTISRVQDPCYECIDGATFRFVLDDGTQIYDDTSDIIEYIMSDVGIWRYDKTTEIVTFIPTSDFVGEARIRYNIKGGKGDKYPYNQEPYRSAPATIGVNIIVNPNPPGNKFIISNKMTTSRLNK